MRADVYNLGVLAEHLLERLVVNCFLKDCELLFCRFQVFYDVLILHF